MHIITMGIKKVFQASCPNVFVTLSHSFLGSNDILKYSKCLVTAENYNFVE